MAAGAHGFRGSNERRLLSSLCAALIAHALLAIFVVQLTPKAMLAEPALQWIELTEAAPARRALGTTPATYRSAPQRNVNTMTSARRTATRAARPRGQEVAAEKQVTSAHDTSAPTTGTLEPARALEAGRGHRAAESSGAGAGSVAPAGGVSGGALATRAVLIASTAACDNFFPALAASDDGVVTLFMHVAPSGRVHSGRVLDERPLGDGFGNAARRCLQRVRFQPAVDRHGQPVASTSVLRLRFARHPGARRRLTAGLTR